MDRKTFLKALSTQLYPILRSEGFRGSGTTLRRVNGPVIHIFHFQGSSSGANCYLNLGAHLLFLPTAGDRVADADTLSEPQCAFRDRYDSPSATGDGWSYCNTLEEMNDNVAFIAEHWGIYGHDFFDRYAEYPQSFVKLLNELDTATVHPAHLLTYARIAANLGDRARSLAIANEALKKCSDAPYLRLQLEQVVGPIAPTDLS